MEKIRYTEYSDHFAGSEGNEVAVTVQVPENPENDWKDIHVIVQEPKLIKFTLEEFQFIEDVVYKALKEAGWKEESVCNAGDGVG